jgi:hypothetical protein
MNTQDLLTLPKTIAIVGLSNKPERPSYQVAEYLISKGFTIVPVNPMIQEALGQKAYQSLSDIPKITHIDIVDIFRKSDEVLDIIKEILALGIRPTIWMQEGVSSEAAKNLAEANGMDVIMNMCMMKVHKGVTQ